MGVGVLGGIEAVGIGDLRVVGGSVGVGVGVGGLVAVGLLLVGVLVVVVFVFVGIFVVAATAPRSGQGKLTGRPPSGVHGAR